VLFLYSCLVRLAVPFAYLVVLWRGFRDRAYWQGLGERFGHGRSVGKPSLWVHAVSLGEVTAAAPLLRELKTRHPDLPLIVTTATPAGRARARSLLGSDADVRFLPYDTPGSVRRFLAATQPRLSVIMETELWPNLLRECRRRGVPVLLASARLSVKSVSSYRRFGDLFRGVFSANLNVAAQTAADAERFRAVGADPAQLSVVGNIKFDIQIDGRVAAAGRTLRDSLGASRPTWTAGSTHAGEEEQLLDAHLRLIKSHPDAVFLLVPRHKDRFDQVAGLLARRGIGHVRRSMMPEKLPADVSVMLGDTLGELMVFYAAADVAYVGGSLAPIGGHNLLEPAALALPVLTGPSYSNAREIAALLLARGAALQVNDPAELAAVLERLIGDPAERERIGRVGLEIIAANRGAVSKLLAIVEARLG
jgi:3-deoxy-D-manno-octulosonic-acid transferase